jgi:hypothetical protein
VDTAYISALSALAGAAIGGLTSFATSWVTQQSQLRHSFRQAERAKLEALYSEFIGEATRLLGDALSHQKDEVTDMVGLYALMGRMRLLSSRRVVEAAERIADDIIQTYGAPNRSLHELIAFAREGRMNLLIEFGEACRSELAERSRHRSGGVP